MKEIESLDTIIDDFGSKVICYPGIPEIFLCMGVSSSFKYGSPG